MESALDRTEKSGDLGTTQLHVYEDIEATLVDGNVTDVQ
jgi:hypothetical protein